MNLTASEQTLRCTDRCNKNYACLSGDTSCLCRVEDCADGRIHFIKHPGTPVHCSYMMSFGYSYTCNCPTRKELYNLYRV